METYDALLNRWKLRGLSLIGRNLIVKSLCLSQITYPFQFVLPNDLVIKDYRAKTEQFIWHSQPKVKRCTTTASISKGGLKIIDIALYAQSIRLAWLSRYVSQPSVVGWRSYLDSLLEPYGGSFLLACNFDHKQLPLAFPSFYKQILTDWFSLPKKPGPPMYFENIAKIVIWNNRDFELMANLSFLSPGFLQESTI